VFIVSKTFHHISFKTLKEVKMALLSPGIEVIEADKSLVVPIAGSSFAVYCGVFPQGACDVPVLLTSVQDLIDTYGKPTNTNYNDWYQIYSFLQYSNTIYAVRCGKVNTPNGTNVQGYNAYTAVKAHVVGTITNPLYIPNVVDFNHKYDLGSIPTETNDIVVYAKSMGAYGNNVKVAFDDSVSFVNSGLQSSYQYAPTEVGEVAVTVSYNGTIVETFLVSLIEGTKDYNNKSMFIDDVINRQSQYIYTISKNTDTSTICNQAQASATWYTLTGGADSVPALGDITDAYFTQFGNKEEIDIDIVIIPEGNTDVAQFCADRADVIGYIGADYNDVVGVTSTQAVTNLVTAMTSTYNFNNKYISYIGNYINIYDRYNDKYRWINVAGQVAGLRAKTNNDRAQWFASAGLNQGILKGVTKLAQNFSQGQRDLLYKNAINTVVSFAGQGIALWGQKTATTKPSSFDRVNVRGLFNYAERAITKMSKYVLFEQNSDTTRNMFVSTVKPFFDRIKAGEGVEDYLIVCDTSNNTAIVRQNNQFVADFYIKPMYAIEFISLRFTAVGASINFSEVVQ
jgi:phage tail sheath protein FI